MGVKITDRMTSEGEKLFKEIAELSKLEVRVGFQAGDAAEADGTDVCQVAAWNEMGTVNMPARPFLRQTADERESDITSFCEAQLNKIMDGGAAQDALKKVGVYVKGLVQEQIVSGSFAPNAASTVKRKGSSQPLIDTGQMRQSVNYFIKSKGE